MQTHQLNKHLTYEETGEIMYRIEINQEIQNAIMEHFGDNLNIYTDQDMYEQSHKIILSYKNQRLNKDKRY